MNISFRLVIETLTGVRFHISKTGAFIAFIFALLPIICFSAQVANVEYTHLYINAKTGVNVPVNPAQTNTYQLVNTGYILAAVDKLNDLSSGSATTTYHANAIVGSYPGVNIYQVADIIAVADAVNRLFNCNVAGYWKQVTVGTGNHLFGGGANDGSGTGGGVTCQACTKDYYCPLGSEARVSCDTVGSGYVTSGTGATVSTDCVAPIYCPSGGQYWTGSACATCPSTSFCPAGQDTSILCSTLAGVNPAGGSYSSVSPFVANTDCRYTAPAKTITGCASVTSQQVTYNGSTWPASTYGVSANAGYYISNNNTASATCTICPKDSYCTGGTNAAVACSTVCTGCTTTGTGATASSQCTAPLPGAADYPQIFTMTQEFCAANPTYNGYNVGLPALACFPAIFNTILTREGIFPNYVVQAMCSNTDGYDYMPGNPVYSSTGTRCWCRLKRQSDGKNGSWIYSYYATTAYVCASECGAYCVLSYDYFPGNWKPAMMQGM